MISRPEHELFGLAMLGGELVSGAAHPYGEADRLYSHLGRQTNTNEIRLKYPWHKLGEATIVDVGGGVGESTFTEEWEHGYTC